MVPRTLMAEELGGDDDPLDIILLGPPLNRGDVVSAKLLGVLKLLDNREQDDKLIAVQFNSPIKKSNSLKELDEQFPGIKEILEYWFVNYKGNEKMKSNGFRNLEEAENILKEASAQSPPLNRSGTDGDSAIVTFYSFLWFIDSGDISTYAGTFTIMFHFAVEDNAPSNDHLRYTIVIEDNLVDLIVNGHDVDTTEVYNSNQPIPANLDVQSRSWPESQNFTTGWSMHLVNPVVAESQDCVDWEMNYTGIGNADGSGELIIHTATHYNATSNSNYLPYDIIVGLTNTSTKLLGNIAGAGSEFGFEHNVQVIATWNGSEVYTENWGFMGDGTLQTAQYNTDLENGTLCFTVLMTVPEIEVAQASHEVGGFTGTFGSAAIPLPDIVAPFAGNFEVRAHINGTYLGVDFDPNEHNDMTVFDIVVNDTTDLWIREVVPARGTTSYLSLIHI